MCKRALGTLLCLCMFCCLLPITVSAAEQTYTVTFDANGGSGSMDSQTAVAEEETALAGNQYTRDGYWFVGWNTAADGTGTAYADGATVTLAASLTLYAQWELCPAGWALGTLESDPAEEDYTHGTLEAAFAAANDNAGTAVTYVRLNRNVSAASEFELAAGKSMVLDLNGHTIEVTASSGIVYGIYANNDSSLVLKNGVVTAKQTGSSDAYGIYSYGDLTLDNCTVTANSAESGAYGIWSASLLSITESAVDVIGANRTYGVYSYQKATEVTNSQIKAESVTRDSIGLYSYSDVAVLGASISATSQSPHTYWGSYGIYAAGEITLGGNAAISGETADVYVNTGGQLWANNRADTPVFYSGDALVLDYESDAKHAAAAVCGVNESNKELFGLTSKLASNYSLVFANETIRFYGKILNLEWYDSDATTLLTGSDYPETIHYGQAFSQLPTLEKAGFVFEGWHYCKMGTAQWSCVTWEEDALAESSMKLKASFATTIGSGEDGARIYSAGNGDVFLGGDYIELGLRPSGAFGTAATVPTSADVVFHATHNDRIGLRSNGDQKWSDGLATGKNQTVDFFLPGTVDEGWMVGWTTTLGESASAKGGARAYGNAYGDQGVVPGTGVDVQLYSSDGLDTLVAKTTANVNGTVDVDQEISFDVTAKYFTTTVTLTNNGAETLYDLSYIRAFDPDQRAAIASSYTDSYFYKDEDGNVWVFAFGNNSLNVGDTPVVVDYDTMVANNTATITPFVFCAQAPTADCGYTVQAVNTKVNWSSTSYSSFYRGGSSSYLAGAELYGKHYYADRGIGLEFIVASLEAGQNVSFSWISSLDTSTWSTVRNIQDAITAKGGTLYSATGSVQLELTVAVGSADKFVVKKDGMTLTDGIDYSITDADTKTPTIQFNASAELNCISVISVEVERVANSVAITNCIPHTWEYLRNNQNRTIDVDCAVDGCTQSAGSVTIAAPTGSLIYNGSAWEATLAGTESLADGIPTPTIAYAGDLTEGKSVNAGDYTASITLGECIAYVDYTIAKAPASAVVTPMASTTIPYGAALSNVALSDSNWTWVDASIIPASSGACDAQLAVNDTNYDYSGIDGYDAQMHAIVRGVQVQVDRATLTITAKNKAVAVGQAIPVLTEVDYTVNGLIRGDTLAGIGLTVSIAYASQPDSSKSGFTDIVVSGTGTPESYLVNYLNGVLTVGSAPAITSTSLPDGTAGVAYSQDLVTTGDGPFTWDVVNGSLPDGLSLLDGTICGTPTTAGTYSFVVQVANGVGSDTRELSITIAQAAALVVLDITTTSLPAGTVGVVYRESLIASDDGAVEWDIIDGSLPDGLSLLDGTICGTPTAAGTYSFVVQVANGVGSDTRELSITIAQAVTLVVLDITTTSLPAGTVGVVYRESLIASDDGAVEWDIIDGSLPDGLSLLDGTICGTPTTAGTFSFVVQVAHGVGSDTRELSITIAQAPAPAAPEITTTSLPGATVGVVYSQDLVTTGDGPFTWDVVNGSLPNGLILSGNTICGTPNTAGTYTFVIQVANDGGSDSIELTLEVADVFLEPCYFVEVQTTDGGAVRTNGSWFWQGETVTVTVAPENGCVLIGLTVVDSRGREICLTEKDQGKYTFQMPACKVTVKASFHRCPSLDYPDVDTSRWYHECIDYVLDHDLMDGIVDGVFEPDGIATRAMLVVAIWRSEGSCSVDYEMSYTDLKEDAPYAEAVRWATSVGIVEGFPDGSFRGDEAITREQMAAVFYRYEKFRGEGYTGDWCYELPYADADAVGAWAYEAVCWNTHMGVVHGDGIRFDPKGTATRAHVAQLLMNYLEQ